MRRALLIPLALLAAGATAGGCPDAPGLPGDGGGAYQPCAGKGCGDACHVCEPGVPGCAETAELKACDPFGACVSATAAPCAPATDGCAQRACGTPCTVDPPCRSATPPCLAPSRLGRCDGDGGCETRLPVPPGFCAPRPPAWGCQGKACGDPCGWCPADADPATCPWPTFAPTACDAALQCLTVGTFTCAP